MSFLEQETMRTILLDTKNRVVAMPTIYRGSLHTTVIRVSELFKEAVRQNCAALIVAHNHPSGDPTPSPEDVAVTGEIVKAGKILDIDVLDHLVIGAGTKFVSLKERGLGFWISQESASGIPNGRELRLANYSTTRRTPETDES